MQRIHILSGQTPKMTSKQSTLLNDRSIPSSFDGLETEPTIPSSPVLECSAADCIQGCKFIKMVAYLDKKNKRLQNELVREKQRRTEELSVIIKSLISMESKLKIDKKLINQRLLKKDTEICRLLCLNRALRKKFNANKENDVAITKDDCFVLETLKCTTCKKKFYAIDTKDNWSQTLKDGRLKTDHTPTELGSSSDDTASSSFYGARRCVRYTSKRTFGTFRDYMRSRCMNIDDPNLDNSAENSSTMSRDDSQNSSEKFNIYSKTIDKLHGVRRVSSIEGDLDSEYGNSSWRKTQSSLSAFDEQNSYYPAEEGGRMSSCASKSDSLNRCTDFVETSPKNEFELSTDNWYASASEGEEDAGVQTNLYGSYVAVNPVLECVNQILLQESMEESNTESLHLPSEGIDSPNLRSSQSQSNKNRRNIEEGNIGTISRKRVHFSPKNSMARVPRNDNEHDQDILDDPLELSPQTKSVIADQIKDNILNYESIYSNEYEPIGSENNSSNLYVDMEIKLSPEDRINLENKPSKQPPALPPKPANLIKFKKAFKVHKANESEELETADNVSILSEPDYCSISEVNAAITSVQVVADVHKEHNFETALEMENPNSDTQSTKTDDIEEIFANIPKLPNVTEIVAPKSPQSKIKYTMQSCHPEVVSKSQWSPHQFKRKHVPNILVEINKRMNNSFHNTPPKRINQIQNGIVTMSSSPSNKSQIPVIKLPLINSNTVVEEKHLPIQAEFDWYNLDVEYGKSPSNHPDIIRASDGNSIDERKDTCIKFHGVEYNLDEEFSLAGNPDIIKENENETPKTFIDPGSPKTVCTQFPFTTDVSPCLKKIKKTAIFDDFLDSSGLTAKPLTRQRKIYFAGPFV